MDLEKAFEIIFVVISAQSYYSIAQDENYLWQIMALGLAVFHIGTIIIKKIEMIVLSMMRFFLTIYYLKGEQSLICFITLQLTIVKQLSIYLFGPTKRKFSFEFFQIAYIQQLYVFQILLLLQLEYRLVCAVISLLLILDIVFAKLISKINFAFLNVRQNPQYKNCCPILTTASYQNFFISIFSIFSVMAPFKRMRYIDTHYARGFQQIYCLFLGITIFILNNIYMFSIECSSYQFVRIYYTLLVIFLLPKIKKDTLFMWNFVQNGPIIDVWPINKFDLQQLGSYSQNLTKNQQTVILDIQNFTSQYISNLSCCFWSLFSLSKRDTYQIIKDNWGLILNSLLQTNKSILIKISNYFYCRDDIEYAFRTYPSSEVLHYLYFLDLEKNELFVNFLEDYKELNQAIINQYNNKLLNFVIDIKVNYYEDSFLPLFIQNYKLLTNEQNIPRDSPSFQEYNTLKYSFVGPAISYFILKKVTPLYCFAIRSSTLLNDLYY
ncbi:hypothetical protein ABPG74_007808 [Tetrahymena malaccensis]